MEKRREIWYNDYNMMRRLYLKMKEMEDVENWKWK